MLVLSKGRGPPLDKEGFPRWKEGGGGRKKPKVPNLPPRGDGGGLSAWLV